MCPPGGRVSLIGPPKGKEDQGRYYRSPPPCREGDVLFSSSAGETKTGHPPTGRGGECISSSPAGTRRLLSSHQGRKTIFLSSCPAGRRRVLSSSLPGRRCSIILLPTRQEMYYSPPRQGRRRCYPPTGRGGRLLDPPPGGERRYFYPPLPPEGDTDRVPFHRGRYQEMNRFSVPTSRGGEDCSSAHQRKIGENLRAYIHVWACGPHVDLHSQLFLSEAEKSDLAASPRDRLF